MPRFFKFSLPLKISNYNNVCKSFLPFPKCATASTHNASNIRWLGENYVLLLLLLLSASVSRSHRIIQQIRDRRSSNLPLTPKLWHNWIPGFRRQASLRYQHCSKRGGRRVRRLVDRDPQDRCLWCWLSAVPDHTHGTTQTTLSESPCSPWLKL